MQEAQNTKIVKDAYDAFGRGDVQTLLGYFDETILWKPVHGAARHVPTAGERRGKAAVGEFFKIVEIQPTRVIVSDGKRKYELKLEAGKGK